VSDDTEYSSSSSSDSSHVIEVSDNTPSDPSSGDLWSPGSELDESSSTDEEPKNKKRRKV